MWAILDACHSWRGPAGAAASDGKHAITDEPGKEERRRALTSGSCIAARGSERASVGKTRGKPMWAAAPSCAA